jgi:predicted permease
VGLNARRPALVSGEVMIQDLKYSLRILLKDRSFTITALLTLTLCIAANTAMFSIVRSVLLKPLPFPGSERIVFLYNSYPGAGAPRVGAAVPDLFDRLEAVPALDQQALFQNGQRTFGDPNGAEQLNLLAGTPSFYRILQIKPAEGRSFTDEDGEEGKDRKVLLSYGFWKRKFAGNRSVIGQTVQLSGAPFEVVGVMPEGFNFLRNDLDLFLPLTFSAQQKSDQGRHNNNFQMIGRLREGASLEQVRQQVDALNRRNDERFPNFKELLKNAQFRTVSVMLGDDVIRDVKGVLYILWGGVFVVLLIGIVNITNLLIVRSSARTREMATRHAIGGEMGRLARQLLTETMVLAVVSGAIGLVTGWWLLKYVASLNLTQLPRGYEIGLDWVSISAIVGLTIAVGALLGIAPVWKLRRMNLNVELREESRGGTASRRANLIRKALATAQVALALGLLVGAGLLLASCKAVMALDLGFDPANVYTAAVSLPPNIYPNPPALITFEQRAMAAIRAIPGVEAAGTTSAVPFSGNINNSVIMAEGYQMKPGESLLAPSSMNVVPGYFEAMHVQLAGGRFIGPQDTQGQPLAVVIDDRLARKFWPDQDAVGRRLYRPTDSNDITKITPETQFLNIVGVIKEMRMLDPRPDVTPVGIVYFPWEQQPGRGPTLVIKTSAPMPGLMNLVRKEIAKIDPQTPVFRERTMQEWIDNQLIGRRLPMYIAIAFGVVALLLSVVGVYGVLAYSVVQRQRELGVRMALGSSTGGVFNIVLKDGVKIVGIGVVAGVLFALGAGQLLKSQLYNVAPMNPLVIVGVTVLLTVVAILATMIPAWRASKINPIIVLGK